MVLREAWSFGGSPAGREGPLPRALGQGKEGGVASPDQPGIGSSTLVQSTLRGHPRAAWPSSAPTPSHCIRGASKVHGRKQGNLVVATAATVPSGHRARGSHSAYVSGRASPAWPAAPSFPCSLWPAFPPLLGSISQGPAESWQLRAKYLWLGLTGGGHAWSHTDAQALGPTWTAGQVEVAFQQPGSTGQAEPPC